MFQRAPPIRVAFFFDWLKTEIKKIKKNLKNSEIEFKWKYEAEVLKTIIYIIIW
jgi:hypothetical protein